jgi:cytochrome b subunit of formate dehydrogenase
MNQNLVKRIIHWSLLIVTVVYALTGLGITQYRTIEPLTFGLLSKFLSFQIHDNLLIPFLILLTLHILLRILLPEYKHSRD